MMFKNLKNRSDDEKRIIGLVTALILTLLIIGCSVAYKRVFVRKDGERVSFFELKQVQDIKNELNSFGDIFDSNSIPDEVLEEQSSSTDILDTELDMEIGSSTEQSNI